MKIGDEEREFKAINQQAFAGKKLLNLDFIQQDHKSEYIFPDLIDLFKKIDPDLFYDAYEKINITHVNSLEQFAAHETDHNELFHSQEFDSDIETDDQISLNIFYGSIKYLSVDENKRDLYKKFIHYLSIKSAISEIQEFLEK
jgi:hypothetical protein